MNILVYAKRWLPVVVWAVFIFYLSSLPGLKTSPNPRLDAVMRSLLHLVFYFIFALLWLRAMVEVKGNEQYVIALTAVFLYSLSDEIHQAFVPTRTFQLEDILIDNLGSFLAVMTARYWMPRIPEKIRKVIKKLILN